MQALTEAFLNVKVGEVQAAVEGREATPAGTECDGPRSRATQRSRISTAICSGRSPTVGPTIAAQHEARWTEALPAMMKSLDEASSRLERAAANHARSDLSQR